MSQQALDRLRLTPVRYRSPEWIALDKAREQALDANTPSVKDPPDMVMRKLANTYIIIAFDPSCPVHEFACRNFSIPQIETADKARALTELFVFLSTAYRPPDKLEWSKHYGAWRSFMGEVAKDLFGSKGSGLPDPPGGFWTKDTWAYYVTALMGLDKRLTRHHHKPGQQRQYKFLEEYL